MKRLQLITRVDPELREAVSKAAGDEGISINDLVIKALEKYLGIPQDSTAITTDNSTDSTSVINDRFEALESEIKAIREELKAIVNAGKSPKKTEPQTAKTIAPGVGTIDNVRIDWKSFIAEFPGKNLDELEEIAVQRYPEKEARRMRDSIGRRLKAKVKGKEA